MTAKPDGRAELSEAYRDLSDEELLERWGGGHLTEIAMEVARAEFARRGIEPPELPAPDDDAGPGPQETVAFVTVARSLTPTDLQILRARLEGDGIPAFVADGEINRMNSLWSIAVGGARLMVPRQFAVEARQIIAHVRGGRFTLREDDDPQ